jgi:hypothetical protein
MSWLDQYFAPTIQVENNGIPLPIQPKLNYLPPGAIAVSNPTNGSIDVSITAPGAVLGVAQVGTNTSVREDARDWVAIAANTTVTIYTLPAPAISLLETVSLSAYISITNQSGGHIGRFTRMIEVVNNGGTITTPNGGTSDSDITPDVGNNLDPILSGATAQIAISGSTLIVRVTAPTSQAIFARLTVSIDRGFLPGTGPTPIVTARSVSSGPGAGGTTTVLTGTGFLGVTAVTLDGAAATFDTPTIDTSLTVHSGAFFGVPGNGPIIVTNANGPGTDTTGGWTYTSTLATPSTIFGSNLKAWYRNDVIPNSGGHATGWTDQSGNGQNLTVGAGNPVYNSSSSNITPAGPSIQFNGTTDYLTNVSFSHGASGDPVFIWVVMRPTSTTGWVCIFSALSGGGLVGLTIGATTSGSPDVAGLGSGIANWGTSIQNLTRAVFGYTDGAPTAGNGFSEVAVSNGTPATNTSSTTTTLSATGTLVVAGNSVLLGGEIFEIVICNVKPTSGQLAAIESYGQTRYGVP